MSNKLYFEDIICARATPPGSSALAVIRISGKNCHQMLDTIFLGPSGKNPGSYASHKVYYGSIIDHEKNEIDKVVMLTFKEGSGFTGEESFEINCHGSDVIVSLIIKVLMANSVRVAEPGEFSKRAFLNGRVDLSEAEAIMDIVHSSTKRSALLAVRQLSGNVRTHINTIKESISDLLAAVEVYIDYPEEDLSIDTAHWKGEAAAIQKMVTELLSGFKRGKLLREGVIAVLLGRTNSGKSTMFNFLLNEDKAIVSDIHGTTRDYIDGVINIEGYGIRLYDTAGLRETADPIEQEGKRRAIELTEKCDLVIYMVSADEGFTEDDSRNLTDLSDDKKVLFVLNKIDKIEDSEKQISKLSDDIGAYCRDRFAEHKIISISALKNIGIEAFNKGAIELLIKEHYSDIDPVITNQRHADLMEKTLSNLEEAIIKLDEQILDLAAFELREGLDNLGEITGEITPEDILDKIFSTFCVGK